MRPVQSARRARSLSLMRTAMIEDDSTRDVSARHREVHAPNLQTSARQRPFAPTGVVSACTQRQQIARVRRLTKHGSCHSKFAQFTTRVRRRGMRVSRRLWSAAVRLWPVRSQRLRDRLDRVAPSAGAESKAILQYPRPPRKRYQSVQFCVQTPRYPGRHSTVCV
jgi:hypothetical protein